MDSVPPESIRILIIFPLGSPKEMLSIPNVIGLNCGFVEFSFGWPCKIEERVNISTGCSTWLFPLSWPNFQILCSELSESLPEPGD